MDREFIRRQWLIDGYHGPNDFNEPLYRIEWTDEDDEEQTSTPMVRWKAELIQSGLLNHLGIDSEIVED